MAPSKARALLRLERVALVSPVFREAWRSGRLSWTRAEALLPLFELERAEPHQDAWLEHAGAVTVRRLRDDVDHALAFDVLDPVLHIRHPAGLPIGAQPRDGDEGFGTWRSGDEWGALDPLQHTTAHAATSTTIPTPPPAGLPTGAQPTEERHQLCFTAPRSVTRLFHAVLATVQRRIERAEQRASSPSEALDCMLEHVFEEWGRYRRVPARYRIHERDGWRCAVPGCSGYRDLQVHHIEYRSRGGNDAPENLVTLCAWHHLRATHGRAHHGAVMSCRGKAPRGLRFSLGLRETGPPLAVYRSGDRVVA
ncbi:MAG: HNH endonuclease [Deltaproteobacteria bacterium]|nr:HNH endonuclease [Deltaproteobacteria bacterium]MBW2417749.1 HNH endonuclease [Deltaproteobacteria bacterium]